MHIFAKIITYFLVLLFNFIPRNKHIWLTGKCTPFGFDDIEAPKFYDNSKYFFLYLVNNTKEKAYWISTSKQEIELLKSYGLPVVKLWSLKGIFLTLRAKYFFHHYGYDQIKGQFQYGSTQINFWHGTPFKKIMFDIMPKAEPQHGFKSAVKKFFDRGSVKYLASTSRYLSHTILTRAADIPESHILNYGYPRTDILKLNKDQTYKFCEQYSRELLPYIKEAQRYKKVFLYMPTWRDDDYDYFAKAEIDFERLNSELKKINAVFFLKLHALTYPIDLDNYSNIIQINNDSDMYPFLNYADYLITDYSSIFFDFLFLDREIIFIPYDYEHYVSTRSLYFDDYNAVTPGIKFKTFSEFIDGLNSIDTIDFSADRERIKNLFIEDYAFNACERTYKFFAG